MEILQEKIVKIEIDSVGNAFAVSEQIVKDADGVLSMRKHRGAATKEQIDTLMNKGE